MVQAKIKHISIRDFKNIGKCEYDFTDRSIIRGAFGSGKTTIFEAYKWALCCGNIDYEPKYNGNIIVGTKTVVVLTMDINGEECVFYRTASRAGNKINSEYEFCGIPYHSQESYKTVVANVFDVDVAVLPHLIDIKSFTTNTTQWT